MNKLKVRDVVTTKHDMVVVGENESIENVLKTLERHKIQSVPIKAKDGAIVGFFDVLDLLFYLVSDESKDNIGALYQKSATLPFQRVLDMIDLSKRNPYAPVHLDDPIGAALLLFSQPVHRVPVHDEAENLVGILSQSDLIKYFVHHPDLLSEIIDLSVLELRLGTSEAKLDKLISINKKLPAIEAFKLMNTHYLSAVAVVDDEGHLFSSISATDLRNISFNLADEFSLKALALPAQEFIDLSRKVRGQQQDFLVWCQPGSALRDVIRHMYENHVHRVYLVDNYINFFGVVSVTDIARLLLEQMSGL